MIVGLCVDYYDVDVCDLLVLIGVEVVLDLYSDILISY